MQMQAKTEGDTTVPSAQEWSVPDADCPTVLEALENWAEDADKWMDAW
jgi:hypothetical protein